MPEEKQKKKVFIANHYITPEEIYEKLIKIHPELKEEFIDAAIKNNKTSITKYDSIETSYDYDYDNDCFDTVIKISIYGIRDETDKEYNARLKKSELKKQREINMQVKKENKEKALLEKLAKKYNYSPKEQ